MQTTSKKDVKEAVLIAVLTTAIQSVIALCADEYHKYREKKRKESKKKK